MPWVDVTFEMSFFGSHILHEVGTYINLNKKVECSGLYGLANKSLVFTTYSSKKCVSLPLCFWIWHYYLIGQRNASRGGSVPVIGLYFRRHQVHLLVPQEAPEYFNGKNMVPRGYFPFSLGPEWPYMEQSYRPVNGGINVYCCMSPTLGVVCHQKTTWHQV